MINIIKNNVLKTKNGFHVFGNPIFLFFIVGIILSYICYIGSMKWLKIKYVTFPLLKKHKKTDKLKILHITDIHGNSSKKMNLDIWKKIEKLDFDFAVITGDLIINEFSEFLPHIEGVKRLAEKAPVFFVHGNHDMFYYKELKKELEKCGVIVLLDEIKTIEINNVKLNVIGLRDFYYLKANNFRGINNLFENIDNSLFTLVLNHQPEIFDIIKRFNPDLILCGHTHGGQLRLPFLPTLFAPHQGFLPKYGEGWYYENNVRMYISRGIGTTVFPIRFFNRPEVTILEYI